MARTVTCPACQGFQRAYVSQAGEVIYNGEPCPLCGATGEVKKSVAESWTPPAPLATCKVCGSDKGLHTSDCPVRIG